MFFISLSEIHFSYPAPDEILSGVNAIFYNRGITAIVGDNGCGKSTLLKIISGEISPDSGHVSGNATAFYMPQFVAPDNFSGGQRQWRAIMRAFKSGADILLLDEPTNNLDCQARQDFFDLLQSYRGGVVVVSHDRELLNMADNLLEIRNGEISAFGGNYDFYIACRNAQMHSLESEYVQTKKEIVRLQGTMARATQTMSSHIAKQAKDKSNARRSRIAANALRGKSVESAGKMIREINQKIAQHSAHMQAISTQLRTDMIKIPMPSQPPTRNELIVMRDVCFAYDGGVEVLHNFSFHMRGCERIRIAGNNGCGKSTLLKLLTGALKPTRGEIKNTARMAYLDQDLTLMSANKTIVENIADISGATYNAAFAIAANFGFRGDAAKKRIKMLSGGEKLKAALAAILGGPNVPDILIMDEPTNNLDINSTRILENALSQYRGGILVVSHDEMFIKNLEIERTIQL